jgi:hypothetical protein
VEEQEGSKPVGDLVKQSAEANDSTLSLLGKSILDLEKRLILLASRLSLSLCRRRKVEEALGAGEVGGDRRGICCGASGFTGSVSQSGVCRRLPASVLIACGGRESRFASRLKTCSF